MTVTLTLREQPPVRIRASSLIPERLQGLDAAAVSTLRVRCGRRAIAVGELFEVSGETGELVVMTGDLSRVDGIGAGMSSGRIVVEGRCGDHAGAGMRGGLLEVRGDAGAWAGAAMTGGRLRVEGDAGARLGGAYPGARAGMTGGEIMVMGDAGEESGAGMRRGLVAVGGRTATGAGLRMLAGTVIALGGIGAEAGMGNKRGSLVSGRALTPLPVYAYATSFAPPALRMQLRQLRDLGLPVDDVLLSATWDRWSGDRTELTRGEILIFNGEERG